MTYVLYVLPEHPICKQLLSEIIPHQTQANILIQSYVNLSNEQLTAPGAQWISDGGLPALIQTYTKQKFHGRAAFEEIGRYLYFLKVQSVFLQAQRSNIVNIPTNNSSATGIAASVATAGLATPPLSRQPGFLPPALLQQQSTLTDTLGSSSGPSAMLAGMRSAESQHQSQMQPQIQQQSSYAKVVAAGGIPEPRRQEKTRASQVQDIPPPTQGLDVLPSHLRDRYQQQQQSLHPLQPMLQSSQTQPPPQSAPQVLPQSLPQSLAQPLLQHSTRQSMLPPPPQPQPPFVQAIPQTIPTSQIPQQSPMEQKQDIKHTNPLQATLQPTLQPVPHSAVDVPTVDVLTNIPTNTEAVLSRRAIKPAMLEQQQNIGDHQTKINALSTQSLSPPSASPASTEVLHSTSLLPVAVLAPPEPPSTLMQSLQRLVQQAPVVKNTHIDDDARSTISMRLWKRFALSTDADAKSNAKSNTTENTTKTVNGSAKKSDRHATTMSKSKIVGSGSSNKRNTSCKVDAQGKRV